MADEYTCELCGATPVLHHVILYRDYMKLCTQCAEQPTDERIEHLTMRDKARLSVTKACDYIDVSRRQMERLLSDGVLDYHRDSPNGKRYLTVADLDAYVQSKAEATPEKRMEEII